MKAIILARVSDKKQDSNEAQVTRVSDYVKHKQLNVWKTYEIEESSTRGDRKKFQEVIKDIEKSDEPIALVADTVDRLQRSFRDSVILDDFRKAGKLEIHFYRENLVLHKDSNSADLLRWDMAVMFARSYVLQLSDNVKRKIDQKLKNGEWIGKAYIGYKNITISEKEKTIAPDKERAFLVKKTFELYASGNFSMKKLAKEMNKRGLTNYPSGLPVATSQIETMLKNPFYYGVMRVKGKLYPHKYEPLISKHLFDKVQKVIESYNKQNFKRTNNPYIFRGMIKCKECGCLLTPEIKKGKYIYYHCTNYSGNCNNVVWIREEDLLEQAANVLKRLKLLPEAIEKLKEDLRVIHESEKAYFEDNINRLNNSLKRITSRYSVIYEDRLDGRITTDEYDEFMEKYKAQEQDILMQIEDHSKGNQDFYITSVKLLDISQRAYELFMRSEPEEKTQLLNFVYQNFLLQGKKLLFETKNPFAGVLEYAKTGNRLRGQDSNLQPID